MGWLGKLFTKGPRKPPAWARDAFEADGAKFDAFVDVVLDALDAAGHAASEMDVRTGSVVLASGEWVIEGTARDCAQCEPSRWPAIVAKSLARDDGDNDDIPAPAVIPRFSQVVGYMAMGNLERADAIAVEAIAAGERVDEMHHQRAMIALMRGDDAAADAELALIDTPQALSSRGIIAVKRGDPAARDYAKRAVAQLPGDVIAIRAAISVHALAGDREGAHAVLAEHGHHLDAGLRAAFDRMIDDPEALANSVVHRFPQHAEMVLDAIAPMITAGKLAEAEVLLRRAATWDPENTGIIAELGFALSQQDRDDEAIAVYTTAIERGGAHNLLRFNRANCLLRRREFTQATIDLRMCLELKPDWHDARVNLTSALFAAGDPAGAAAEIAQLEELGGSAEHVTALRKMLAGTL